MDSACHLKWLHESPDCLLILRFEDQDEGVQAIEYRVGYDFNAKLHGVEWAEAYCPFPGHGPGRFQPSAGGLHSTET